MKAACDLNKGQEIFITYGDKKRRFCFFMTYGFVMNPEVEDAGIAAQSWFWSLASTDKLLSAKLALMRSQEKTKSYTITPDYEDECLGKFIAFNRFIVYDDDLKELKELVLEAEDDFH
jgi:hypothetical protein